MLFCGVAAQAATQAFSVGANPVIRISAPSGRVHIIGWNQPTIQINSGNAVDIQHGDTAFVNAHYPRNLAIPGVTPPSAYNLPSLRAESFALPNLGSGEHNGVFLRGSGDITMRVPMRTSAIIVDVGTGQIAMANLRGTTMVATTRQGGIFLRNVSGTAFTQTLRGPVVAVNSTFERIRSRSLVGNLSFAHCDVQQIAASSVTGSVMYDDGRFRPGLARFESQRGSVAIGIAQGSNAQVNTSRGTVFSHYNSHSGPVVTAMAGRSVLLYNGSLESHPNLAHRAQIFSAPAFKKARQIRAGGAYRGKTTNRRVPPGRQRARAGTRRPPRRGHRPPLE